MEVQDSFSEGIFCSYRPMYFRSSALSKIINRRTRLNSSRVTRSLNASTMVTFIYLVSRVRVYVSDIRAIFLGFVNFRLFRRSSTTSFLIRMGSCSFTFLLSALRYFIRLLTAFTTRKTGSVANYAEEVCASRSQFIQFRPAFCRNGVFRSITFLTRESRTRITVLNKRVGFSTVFCSQFYFRAV